MKTTILLSCFLLWISVAAFGQIEKGKVQIGGSVSAAHNKSNPPFSPENKYTSVAVSPAIGAFYKTNRLAGVFLNYAYYESTNSLPAIVRSYGGGVFFRQYKPLVKSLYLLFDERGSYNYQSGKDDFSALHGYTVAASLQAGMAYDVTKNLQIEMLLNNLLFAGYSNSNRGNSYNVSTYFDDASLSNVLLGFRFYLK